MAAPGYVDFAVPITQFRLRFDAAYDDNRPDRAEFFYGKCGCFAMLPADQSECRPARPRVRPSSKRGSTTRKFAPTSNTP